MTMPPTYPDSMILWLMHLPVEPIYSKILNIKYSTLPTKTAKISIIFSLNSPSLSPLKISEVYADYARFKYPIFGKLTGLMTDYFLIILVSYNVYINNIILDNATLQLL